MSCFAFVYYPMLFICAFFGIVSVFIAFTANLPFVIALGLLTGIAVPIVVHCFAADRGGSIYDSQPVVELKNGIVTFAWDEERRCAPLATCRVRLGDACEARLGRRAVALFPGYRAILLSMPPFSDVLSHADSIAPVGFDAASRMQWQAAIAAGASTGIGVGDESPEAPK